jgi:5'-nucleotidase
MPRAARRRLRHHGRQKIRPAPDLIRPASIPAPTSPTTLFGTVAGAMEGALLGVRSIALSQAYSYVGEDRVVPYETTEALGPALLQKLVAMPLPDGVLLNVNFPNCLPEEVAGTVVTSQGKLVHSLWVDERRDGRGLPYYWLRFGATDGKQGTDLHAMRNRLVSVTPLQLDLTAHEIRDQLTKALS